ncbi:MAG: hypothetical protein AAGI01_02340, partial [Myxococcota bacterium]
MTRTPRTPGRRRHATLLAIALALGASACTTGRGQRAWPAVDVLPEVPPRDLDKSAPTTLLRRGSDGLLYLVGGLAAPARPGAHFLARYSGEWPLVDIPRPPLAAGQIVKRFDERTALV